MENQQCVFFVLLSHIAVNKGTVHCCLKNATMGTLCLVVKLQSISYCCGQYICPIWNKSLFSKQIYIKSSKTKIHKNPSTGNWVVTCGQVGRHDKALRRTFCNW